MPSKERKDRERLKRENAEPQTIAEPTADESGPKPAAFITRPDAESKGTKERVGFNVTADGKADWGSMQKRSKEKLAAVIKNDPEFAKMLGRSESPDEPAFAWTQKDILLALRKMNQMNAVATRFVFARFKGIQLDPDICAQAFQMRPEDEKELSERGCRLANRYSTEWMRKHADLILFISVYLDSVGTQAASALMMQFDRNARRAAAVQNQSAVGQRVNGHSPEVQPHSEPIDITDLRG